MKKYDAVIIGSGPNGLAAGILIIKAGLSVLILESNDKTGGGTRTSELTIPGFKHDICSAVHPLGAGSPFFQGLPLSEYGLKWIYPARSVVHPFEDGTAAFVSQSLDETADSLGTDSAGYKKLMIPLLKNSDAIIKDILSPLSFPSDIYNLIRFGLKAFHPAYSFAHKMFKGQKARSLFAGLSAHSILPLNKIFTSAFGLLLGITGHKPGWPVPEGGSQRIADALSEYFKSLGGEIRTSHTVRNFSDIPESRIKIFDLTPSQIINIMGDKLPMDYLRRLKKYRYGPGVFKIDYALSDPIPFKSPLCSKSGTIHIGGSIEEITFSENQVWHNKIPDKPFSILVQPSLFDSSRAPEGKHTAWVYCHVPNGSVEDMTNRIENQIERFAPGFRDVIVARNKMNTEDLEIYNENYVGGDINGGAQDWEQLFSRPVFSLSPYSMPLEGFYICSSSTPPGGGVHGMCGYNAAKKILGDNKISLPVK